MKKDITLFISKTSHEQNLINRFTELVKSTKTKSDMRELEMRLLRPRPIKRYKGKRPGQTTFKKRCILLTFKSNNIIKTWAKYFRVNTYVENNTYDLDFLVELFRLMELGLLKWNQKEKTFEFLRSYLEGLANDVPIFIVEDDLPKRKIKRRKKVVKRKIKRRQR